MATNFVTPMYDTVHFILFRDDYPEKNFLKEIPSVLTQITNHGDSRLGPFMNGFLDTYKVSLNPWRAKFQESSLGKFIHGDNLQGMSLKNTRDAFDRLSDHLHLDINQAKVTRLDLGRNIIMRLPPATYLEYLGEHVHYRRYPMETGLLYKNSSRELAFYDKILEQKSKRVLLPELFRERNLIRFEMRYKNHLEREFGVDRLTVRHLTEERFYIDLLKRWKQEYSGIKKLSRKVMELEPSTSTRELLLNLAAMALKDIGSDGVIKRVGEWHELGLITKKQAGDHRKAIRDILQKDFKSNGNELIEELDKKIKEAIRFFI